jgi:MFS family permease
MVAFCMLAALLLSTIAFGDRSHLLDQDNYVQYFAETNYTWFSHLWLDSQSLGMFVVRMVTDELGWRFWVVAVNSLGFSPETGVRITVLALNLLMIYALSKTRWPLLSLILWAVIPTGLATVGLFQIRQGFALAIAMYFAQVRRQPVRGALIASVVHTTFAFPAIFLLVTRIFAKRSYFFAVFAASATAVGMAVAAALLFKLFGGRRLDEYNQHETYTVFNLIGIVIYMVVPALVLWSRDKRADGSASANLTREMATMHISVLVFLVVSFFVYPFGMARIDYYATLLIAFLLPDIRIKNTLVLWTIAVVLLVLGYDAVKQYLSGLYAYFF